MALFRKDRPTQDVAPVPAQAPIAGAAVQPTFRENREMTKGTAALGGDSALLGRGTRITGKVFFESAARIEGHVEGEIEAKGLLSIGEHAVVNAQIVGTTIVVHGRVTGDIRASEKLEVRSPGKLFGNVTTPSLVIEEGVVFEGQCSMGTTESRAERVSLLAKEAPASAAAATAATAASGSAQAGARRAGGQG